MHTKKLVISSETVLYFLFDVSLLLYFVVYLTFSDSAEFSNVRNVASIAMLFSGSLMLLRRGVVLERFVVAYAIFAMWGFLSLIWAIDGRQIIGLMNGFIRILLLFLFIKARIKVEKDIEKILIVAVIAIIYREIYIGQLMLEIYNYLQLLTHRFGDPVGYNSNENAMIAVIGFYVLFYFFSKKKHKLIPLVGMIFLGLIVLVCGSRKGILSLVLIGILFALLKSSGASKLSKFLIGILSVFVGIEMCYNIPVLYDAVGYRLEALFSLLEGGATDGSMIKRIELMQQAFNVWLDNPILGVGLNNFSLVQTVGGRGYYAHNNFLELLADVGIIGFLLYYVNIFSTVFTHVAKENTIAVLLKSICIILLIMDIGMVTYNSWLYLIFYYLLFICGTGRNKDVEIA